MSLFFDVTLRSSTSSSKFQSVRLTLATGTRLKQLMMSRKEELTLKKKSGFERLLHLEVCPCQGSKSQQRPLPSLPQAREPLQRTFLSKTVLFDLSTSLSSLTPSQDGSVLMGFDLKRVLL